MHAPSERDDFLYEYFLNEIRPLVYPIAQIYWCDSSQPNNFLFALTSNKAIMHCCLGIAAMHLKSYAHGIDQLLDNNIVRHAYATTAELRASIQQDNVPLEVLQAVLSIISLQCLVGRPADCLLELLWQHHFRAATSLLCQLRYSNEFTTALTS